MKLDPTGMPNVYKNFCLVKCCRHSCVCLHPQVAVHLASDSATHCTTISIILSLIMIVIQMKYFDVLQKYFDKN